MKKLITLLSIFAFLSTSTFASHTNPESSKDIINTTTVKMSVVNIQQKAFFTNASYNTQNDVLEFVTKDKVNYLQIFKGDRLEYQLPVMSNKLKISKALFKDGNYKLGFITQSGKKIEFANLEIH